MIKIYKNVAANSIFIEDPNGARFINSLQAVRLDPNNNKLSIFDNVENIYLVYEQDFSLFVNENGQQWGGDAGEAEGELNAIFQDSGTGTTNLPVITSPLVVEKVQGATLSYELTANFGVGTEWDLTSVDGVTTVDGNMRRLIGGSNLPLGSYNIPVKSINYNGEDSQVLVLNVTQPAFANTFSVDFENNNWLGGNAGILQNVFGRPGNGSGASDAWTWAQYIRAGSFNSNAQTLFYCGSADVSNGGHIYIRVRGNDDSLEVRYGSDFNFIKLRTQPGSLPVSAWTHIAVCYDGGATGSSSGNLNDYYSTIKIYINNVLQTTINSHSNFGYSGSIQTQNFRIGRYSSGNYLRASQLDEMCIFDSDQSANVGALYNNGVPFDLSTLSTSPLHWWRCGDGDTYPYMFDNGTANNLILQMYGMSAGSFVNNTP